MRSNLIITKAVINHNMAKQKIKLLKSGKELLNSVRKPYASSV